MIGLVIGVLMFTVGLAVLFIIGALAIVDRTEAVDAVSDESDDEVTP